VLIASLGVRSG